MPSLTHTRQRQKHVLHVNCDLLCRLRTYVDITVNSEYMEKYSFIRVYYERLVTMSLQVRLKKLLLQIIKISSSDLVVPVNTKICFSYHTSYKIRYLCHGVNRIKELKYICVLVPGNGYTFPGIMLYFVCLLSGSRWFSLCVPTLYVYQNKSLTKAVLSYY